VPKRGYSLKKGCYRAIRANNNKKRLLIWYNIFSFSQITFSGMGTDLSTGFPQRQLITVPMFWQMLQSFGRSFSQPCRENSTRAVA